MDNPTPPAKTSSSKRGCLIAGCIILALLIGMLVIGGVAAYYFYKNFSNTNNQNFSSSITNQFQQIATNGKLVDPTQTLTHLAVTKEDIVAIAKDEGYDITFEQLLTGSINSYSATFDHNTLVVTEDKTGIFSVALTSTGGATIDAAFIKQLATRIDPDINTNQWLDEQLNTIENSTDSITAETTTNGKIYNINSTVVVYDDGSVYQKQVMLSINGQTAGQ